MRLTYQVPEKVMIGHQFPQEAFVLQNSWNLEVVDLDKMLRENNTGATTPRPVPEASRLQKSP